MKIFKLYGFIIGLLILEGCWPSPSVITTANATQPVLVGNVKIIGGKPVAKKDMLKSNPFAISVTNSFQVYSSGYSTSSKRISEGSNVVDVRMQQVSGSLTNDLNSVIMADSIQFTAWSGYWIFAMAYKNEGTLIGAKYTENSK
jgi:hypothetical protein